MDIYCYVNSNVCFKSDFIDGQSLEDVGEQNYSLCIFEDNLSFVLFGFVNLEMYVGLESLSFVFIKVECWFFSVNVVVFVR